MVKNSLKNKIPTCFYEGKYNEVLALVGSEPLDPAGAQFEFKTSFQLAALVFLGNFRESIVLFERAIKVANPSALFLSRCRFFLGIGCVRQSNYSEAVKYFSKNVLALKKMNRSHRGDHHEQTFYAYQGSAFYRFFQGHFKKSNSLARKAYSAAYENNFKYGQVLSLDLMGHTLCQIGSVNRGLHELEAALEIANGLGNGGIVSAIKVSMVKYRAQFGIAIQKTVGDLEKAVNSLQPQDNYSKAELYLELIRQLILRGKGSQAKNILEEAGKIIYRHQNKRQYAVFNLRSAYLQLLNGERQAALALAVSLKSNLDPKVDLVILQQANGLIQKINSTLGDGSKLEAHFLGSSTNIIDSRIKFRTFNKSSFPVNSGEDPVGDVIDKIANGEGHVLYQIKMLGLWGLVPKILNLPIGANGIFLGPLRGELIIFCGADIIWVDQGITSPIKKLILNLKGLKFKSKEYLVSQTWEYKYDPSIHDRLLHATIGKLRNLLRNYGFWIEWSGNGYKLADHVSVFLDESVRPAPAEETKIKAVNNSRSQPTIGQNDLELNIRQFKLMSSLKPGDFISVGEYAKLYKMCNMTACRDLTSLHLSGRMLRMGKGRATFYRLP